MSISIKSRKAKGRRLQNYVANMLNKFFGKHNKGAIMGEMGEDIKMDSTTSKQFPYSIECKSRKAFSIYKDYDQAARHCSNTFKEPLLIIKADRRNPLAIMDLEHFVIKSCEWFHAMKEITGRDTDGTA